MVEPRPAHGGPVAMNRRVALLVGLTLTLLPSAAVAAQPPARVDAFGDPLPPGAIARLGTTRFRVPSTWLGFSKDSKSLLCNGYERGLLHLDVLTGKVRATVPIEGLANSSAKKP